MGDLAEEEVGARSSTAQVDPLETVLPQTVADYVRASLAINNNAALEILLTKPHELRKELKFTAGLYPALIRAIRLATEGNHDVFYEYFILGLILEEETRLKFTKRGYNWETVHSWCHARLGRFPPTGAKKQLPEFARLSDGLDAWFKAARKIASERVLEHQTLILDDFFDAVSQEKDLSEFHLARIRQLLQQGKTAPRLPLLPELISHGFKRVLDDTQVLKEKSDRILGEIQPFRVEARVERKAIKSDTENINSMAQDILAQTTRLGQMLPQETAVSQLAVAMCIVSAIGVGVMAGLVARLYFGLV